MTAVRGTLTALVVVLLVTGGAWAPAGVVAGSAPTVTAETTAVGETAGVLDTTTSDGRVATTATASGGAGGSDGNLPLGAGTAIVGVGAAAIALLVRHSASVVGLVPNVGVTVSRLLSPFVQLWGAGRLRLSRLVSLLGRVWNAPREWLPHVLAAVGYSRYDDSDPLSHPTRAELYDRIAASPGTYLSELSEQADVPTSTVRHHLDVLVGEGVVTTANVRGRRRYFTLGAGNETLAAALEDDASAAVIECLAERGSASVSTVADDLNKDVSTVSHHLQRLAEDDLVEREREGRSVTNELTPEVEDALGSEGQGTRRA